MHAGLYAKYAIEKMARIPVIVEVASEFRYSDPILSDKDTVLIISQSGETADSLEALRIAKSKGARTIAVVNVIASSIAREADNVIYTYAGSGDFRRVNQGVHRSGRYPVRVRV